MPSYYRNEALFSEIYLEEITTQTEKEEINISLQVLREYREYADTNNQESWESSYVREVFSALGFTILKEQGCIYRLSDISNPESQSSVCVILGPDEDLNSTSMGRNWMEKTIRALRENHLEWGLLTNGKQWRILHQDEPQPYETYLEIDLESILNDQARDAYRIFHQFMKAQNFKVNHEGQCKFDQFKKESRDKIDYIEKELANALKPREEGGKGVLSDICLGYVQELHCEGVHDFEDEDLRKKIYHGAMLYMFRLLFLFYADARGLLSDANHKLLAGGKEMSRDLQTKGTAEADRYELWKQFDIIFVDIDQTYNGGLFSPQESEFTRFISEIHISDHHLASGVYYLTTYRERNREEKAINYRDMGVRHLGTLYEGLLEHKLFIADEETEVKLSKGKIRFIPVSQGGKLVVGHTIKAGQVYFAGDPSERKSSGSYFTPEDVVDFIVNNTVGEKIKQIKEDFMDQEKDNQKAFLHTKDESERKALATLLEENALLFVRDKVLLLSVLDPAMGSGHFLINATNLITNFITELMNEMKIEGSAETGPAHWRRWVVENCIYGVDLNPLAVELAKLSLWILSMAKDQPLSFLNHHLKCGNSLVGAKLDDIGNYPLLNSNENSLQLNLFEGNSDFKATIEEVVSKIRLIVTKGTSTIEDVIKKKDWLEEIEIRLEEYKTICNLHTNLFFDIGLEESLYKKIIEKKDTKLASKYTIENNVKYFHWKLEFPEQFFINKSGFDILIGNPPYADITLEFEKFVNLNYYSSDSGDLYTLFIEKLIELCNEDGFSCYVLPLSITFNRKMEKIRKKILSQKDKSWKIPSFDRIPDALFGGNVRTRNSILIGRPNYKSESELYMTPMYRWFAHERKDLFSSINYFQVNDILDYHDGWPKIGSDCQVKILLELFKKNNNLGSLVSNSSDKCSAPQILDR